MSFNKCALSSEHLISKNFKGYNWGVSGSVFLPAPTEVQEQVCFKTSMSLALRGVLGFKPHKLRSHCLVN